MYLKEKTAPYQRRLVRRFLNEEKALTEANRLEARVVKEKGYFYLYYSVLSEDENIEKIMAAHVNFYVFHIIFYILFAFYTYVKSFLHSFETVKPEKVVFIFFI